MVQFRRLTKFGEPASFAHEQEEQLEALIVEESFVRVDFASLPTKEQKKFLEDRGIAPASKAKDRMAQFKRFTER